MLEKGKDEEEENKEGSALNHACTRCEKAYKILSSLTRHMVDKHNFFKIPKGKGRRGDRTQVDQ